MWNSQEYTNLISKFVMRRNEDGATPLRPATNEEIRLARAAAGLPPQRSRIRAKWCVYSLIIVVLMFVLILRMRNGLRDGIRIAAAQASGLEK